MRVFVYEHLCGSTLAAPASASLCAEGWAMLAAVVEDFTRCPEIEPITLLHPSLLPLAAAWPAGVRIEVAGEDEEGRFRTLAASADGTLVIAPEFDDILATRCRWVEEAGGRLLGPSAAAVRRTADKLELSRWFLDAGIPTPPALSLPCAAPLPWPLPWVCKPRDGAGSQATFLIERAEDLATCMDRARAEGWEGETIVQPYLPGQAASVACLVGPGRVVALPAAQQRLSSDGRFHYEGGILPLPRPLPSGRAQQLAKRAVRVVPGLLGYVGVDLIVGDAADGSGDAVVEINPRLTTSYVGLRRLALFNVAEALLALVAGKPRPGFAWRRGIVQFFADGRVVE
jgi:predicted ATP-grasp superfamily ATP-dependent carboligase